MEDHLPATDAAVWTDGACELGILILRQEILGAPAHRLHTGSIAPGAKLANDRPAVKQIFHHLLARLSSKPLGFRRTCAQVPGCPEGVHRPYHRCRKRRWCRLLPRVARPASRAYFDRMIVQIATMPAAGRRIWLLPSS